MTVKQEATYMCMPSWWNKEKEWKTGLDRLSPFIDCLYSHLLPLLTPDGIRECKQHQLHACQWFTDVIGWSQVLVGMMCCEGWVLPFRNGTRPGKQRRMAGQLNLNTFQDLLHVHGAPDEGPTEMLQMAQGAQSNCPGGC